MYGKAAAAVLAGLCLVNRPPTVRAQSTFAGQSCAASDTNGDGSVNVSDLLALLASFDCTYDTSGAVEADVCTVDMSASFNWVELVGADGATKIGDGDWTSGAQNTWESDDGWVDVDVGMLGNCFNWYGRCENKISIGTNGVITFGTAHYAFGGSEPIPCGGTSTECAGGAEGIGVDGAIAVYWADTNPGATSALDPPGNVWYGPGDGGFVAEWSKVMYWSDPERPDVRNTFEAILYPGGAFKLQYLTMSPEHLSWSTESIGFEDQTGKLGTQISFGEIPAPQTAYGVTAACHVVSEPPCTIGPKDYNFIDIAGTGTAIGADDWTSGGQNDWQSDDGWFDVDISAMGFNWYGTVENTVSVGTNGVITFGTNHYKFGGSEPTPCQGGQASCSGLNVDGVLAVFWADINPGAADDAAVLYSIMPSGTMFIAQWDAVMYWSDPERADVRNTFQAVLMKNGDVSFSYADMSPEHLSWSTESIGFEDNTGTLGFQISFGEIPTSGTTYGISAACHAANPGCFINTAATPDWVDIVSAGGTLVGPDDWTSGGQNTWSSDDGWFDVDISAMGGFTWYGRRETMISAGTNGVITFGTDHYMYGGSEPMPCASEGACGDSSGFVADGLGVDGAIGVFWADINPGGSTADGAGVYTWAGAGKTVVTWHKCMYWSDPERADVTNTFQAVLSISGDVSLNYQEMNSEQLSWSAESIGYEDQSGSLGVQISYGEIPSSGTTYTISAGCTNTNGASSGHYPRRPIGGYSYIGCFQDNSPRGARDMHDGDGNVVLSSMGTEPNTNARVLECAASCNGYKYMAMQWSNECFCGNVYNDCERGTNCEFGDNGLLADGECDSDGNVGAFPNYADLCGTNGEANCGDHNAVYEIVYSVPPIAQVCDTSTGTGDPREAASIAFFATMVPALSEMDLASSEIALLGDAAFTDNGLVLDGEGDSASIANFDYAKDASFTIGLWFQKTACHRYAWEYLYSHAEDAGASILAVENDNVNLYLGCETNWVDAAGVYTDGTAAAAGSFMRTIIVDGAGTVGVIDLNIHAAGSFNMITSRWNHVMLRVAPDSMAISLDGANVGDEAFAVYHHTQFADSAASTFWPTPSALQVPFTEIVTTSAAMIGARADSDVDRHFPGSIYGVAIYTDTLSAAEAACAFAYEMPYAPIVNAPAPDADVSVDFISDTADAGTNPQTITLVGTASTDGGLIVDGAAGNRATISNFDYGSDASFSISFWAQKAECTTGPWEYIYSHAESTSLSILDLGNTNVNIYVGCDSNDPTASFIRTILIDDSDTYGITYDFPLSASADWSTVLEEWVFMTTSVSPSMVALMVDGEDKSSGDLFSCCLEAKGTTMTQDFTGFTFVTDIYVGARADENADRHYAGKIAGLKIHSSTLGLAESQAIMDGDTARIGAQLG